MKLLALDIGSSSVKCAILLGGRYVGGVKRVVFPTAYDGVRAEVDPEEILRALAAAIQQLGAAARRVDVIAISNMAPSWVAMDKHGRAITPIVTHQDRRSVDVARELEKTIGKARHLKLAGNRPFPGGISSTTWAWFNRHEPRLMKRADLVGHLNTFLHRKLTAARVTDPSNASFTGLFNVAALDGWNEELMEAVGATEHQLPQLISADGVGGLITRDAGRRFHLTHGTPVLVGMIDGGGAMLLAGAKAGQLTNSAGSTDVLAVCLDQPPRPHERLLTRALGVDRKWLQVSTLAAGGSTFTWLHDQLARDLSKSQYQILLRKIAKNPVETRVRFDPYLAGDRMSIEQRRAAFTGLTLATTRDEMLSAAIESLAAASAERVKLLRSLGIRLRRDVIITGGLTEGLGELLYRDWPGKWTFRVEDEASLRGLARLV
ncbi:MAG: xylulokinase [Phycisphaerales bacterium]|jgi:xylulokinase|nr:xylulokinase [Phycisphaerales bacterium]